MTQEERDRALELLTGRFEGRQVPAEESNWLELLLERYAPLLTQAQQMERFTNYLSSQPKPPKDAGTDVKVRQTEQPLPARGAGTAAAKGLHDGPSVVLARAERRPGLDVTRDGTSWFGGLPALGDEPRPMDNDGSPMTPLAQIDLTGLARHLQVPGLPETARRPAPLTGAGWVSLRVPPVPRGG